MTSTATIRIAVADDHPMIIGGLSNLFSLYPHLHLTGSFPDGDALLKGLEKQQPDVLLLDIQLPGKTGDVLAPLILKKYPAIRILALTNLDSVLYIHNMFRLGVSGYVLKNSDPDRLIEAIEAVYQGETFLATVLKDQLEKFQLDMRKEAAVRPSLTPREKEILQLTVNGDTIQEISEKLFIGLRTVEYYRSNLFLKLEVKNMASLIKKALKLGMVD